MVSKDEIMAALRQVNDPDIGKGIVELDSVKDVEVQGTSIKVSVELTEKIFSMNMLVENFIDQIKRVLKTLPGVQEVLVETLLMNKEQQEKLYALKAQQTSSRPVADKGIDRLSKMGIKHIIAIISGKGGVGKTLVTGLLAVELRRLGFSVGILDADVTGPSIPKIFGVRKSPTVINESKLDPPRSKTGIKLISMNVLLGEKEEAATVWRGPIINSVIRQLYHDVEWGTMDYLLVDLPPGTSDAPLTVFQSIPLDGVIVVTSPQELAWMIVQKAVNMAKQLNVSILGLFENMSYVKCPDCGKEIHPYGKSRGESAAKSAGILFLGSLPIDPQISSLCDQGKIEEYRTPHTAKLVETAKTIPSKAVETPAFLRRG